MPTKTFAIILLCIGIVYASTACTGKRLRIESSARHLTSAFLSTSEMILAENQVIRFSRLPLGHFNMGSPLTESERWDDELPFHVYLTQEIEVQESEVTQLNWFTLMGNNPSRFKEKDSCPSDFIEIRGVNLCPNHPVENVSWNDAILFAEKLNQRNDGFSYGLPSEAEWEFAARGGVPARYHFGNDVKLLPQFAWYDRNSRSQTHPVKSKAPNRFGLFDTIGNVWEWVSDWHGPYPSTPQKQPIGPTEGTSRIIRGGSFGNDGDGVRVANRGMSNPLNKSIGVGFRLKRTRRLPADSPDQRVKAEITSRHVTATLGPQKVEINLENYVVRLLLALNLQVDYEGQIRTYLEQVLKNDEFKINGIKRNLLAVLDVYKPSNSSSYRRRLEKIKSKYQYTELNDLSREIINATFDGRKRTIGKTEFEQAILKAHFYDSSINAAFSRLSPQNFKMGSPDGESERDQNEDLHEVRVPTEFDIQETEVTQHQWVQLMGYNPSEFSRASDCPLEHFIKNEVELCLLHPVENISWDEAQFFLQELNQRDPLYKYNLPTEIEWEFAARGGNGTAYHFGNDPRELDNFAWWHNNSAGSSHTTRSKKPNDFGLFDLHGNVWEWTSDWFAPYGNQRGKEKFRSIRGGSWFSKRNNLRSANRGNAAPHSRAPFIGLRLVRTKKSFPPSNR